MEWRLKICLSVYQRKTPQSKPTPREKLENKHPVKSNWRHLEYDSKT